MMAEDWILGTNILWKNLQFPDFVLQTSQFSVPETSYRGQSAPLNVRFGWKAAIGNAPIRLAINEDSSRERLAFRVKEPDIDCSVSRELANKAPSVGVATMIPVKEKPNEFLTDGYSFAEVKSLG
jgi:hypothetical protein